MLLYHFTSSNNLSAIRKTGLIYGKVPAGPNRWLNAVWLTTDSGADGHGLVQGGDVMTEAERRQVQEWTGVLPPAGARNSKEASARITVRVSENDRNLHAWLPWARQHLAPDLLATIHPAGCDLRPAKTWRLYFAVILPTDFAAIDLVETAVQAPGSSSKPAARRISSAASAC